MCRKYVSTRARFFWICMWEMVQQVYGVDFCWELFVCMCLVASTWWCCSGHCMESTNHCADDRAGWNGLWGAYVHIIRRIDVWKNLCFACMFGRNESRNSNFIPCCPHHIQYCVRTSLHFVCNTLTTCHAGTVDKTRKIANFRAHIRSSFDHDLWTSNPRFMGATDRTMMALRPSVFLAEQENLPFALEMRKNVPVKVR